MLEKSDKERLVGIADQLSGKNKEKVVALAKVR